MSPRRDQTKHWCFTSYDVEKEPFADFRDKVSYLVYGRETCPETGRKHLQGYVAFKNRQRMSAIKKMDGRSHFERMRGTSAEAADYCKKDGDFSEFGVLPPPRAANLGFPEAVELAKAGDYAAMLDKCPGLYVRYKANFEALRVMDTTELSDSCGVWISGPPRCGKDYAVRQLGKSLFNKALNKWWDGYAGEDYVLLSDVDITHGVWMANFLKIWMDRYAFTAEIKGGSMKIRPKKIFVTSNYSLSEVFSGHNYDAIAARCHQMSFTSDVTEPLIVRRPRFEPSERVLAPLRELLSTEDAEVFDTPSTPSVVSGAVNEAIRQAVDWPSSCWSDDDFQTPSSKSS